MGGWTAPIHITRTGASHLRRGTVCQDASVVRRFRSLDGAPVWVMAVADGHGHHRHRLSDIGSRLACAEALEAVALRVGTRAVRREQEWPAWEDWLREELPEEIHRRWLAAIAADWRERAAEEAEPFAAELYGSTLGLVVMTPLWWGHTGIGDWDLVRVDGSGTGELLEQEVGTAGRGEATFSLCQSRAPSCFRSRARLHPLPPGSRPFALVLSTDGVRKSCSTDGDFLALAAHLAGVALRRGRGGPQDELASTLDRITAEGSGDDVSVAVAGLGRLRLPDSGSGSGSERATAGDGDSRRPLRPLWVLTLAVAALVGSAGSIGYTLGRWMASHDRPAPQGAAEPWLQEATRLCSGAPVRPGLQAPGPVNASTDPAKRPLGAPSPQPSPQPPGTTPGPLKRPAAPSVSAPGTPPSDALRIRSELQTRRSQFDGLRSGRLRPEALRGAAASDPLGALIAASFDPRTRTLVSGSELEKVAPCPVLAAELRRQWGEAARRSGSPEISPLSPPGPPPSPEPSPESQRATP